MTIAITRLRGEVRAPIARVVGERRRDGDRRGSTPVVRGRRRERGRVARSRAPIEKGMPSERVRRVVVDWLAAAGHGSAKITYRLRRLVFSRQRYWASRIPIYSGECDGDPRKPGAAVRDRLRPADPARGERAPARPPRPRGLQARTDPAGPLARGARLALLREERAVVRARDEHDAAMGLARAGTTSASSIRTTRRRRGARRPTTRGCPSTSTSAGASTPCSTSSTPGSGTRCSSTRAREARGSRSRSSSIRASSWGGRAHRLSRGDLDPGLAGAARRRGVDRRRDRRAPHRATDASLRPRREGRRLHARSRKRRTPSIRSLPRLTARAAHDIS